MNISQRRREFVETVGNVRDGLFRRSSAPSYAAPPAQDFSTGNVRVFYPERSAPAASVQGPSQNPAQTPVPAEVTRAPGSSPSQSGTKSKKSGKKSGKKASQSPKKPVVTFATAHFDEKRGQHVWTKQPDPYSKPTPKDTGNKKKKAAKKTS